jgi:hypothetical protein
VPEKSVSKNIQNKKNYLFAGAAAGAGAGAGAFLTAITVVNRKKAIEFKEVYNNA